MDAGGSSTRIRAYSKPFLKVKLLIFSVGSGIKTDAIAGSAGVPIPKLNKTNPSLTWLCLKGRLCASGLALPPVVRMGFALP